ncbi:OmpA family protein [Flavobacteriaceae bacterium MAR_2010_188]|nr:OmpA family protein [Flavobacteriaceae bacterium MAR_2010_188]
MKRYFIISIALALFSLNADAQIFKKIKKSAERTIERKLEKKVGKETGKAMDTILDGKDEKSSKTSNKNNNSTIEKEDENKENPQFAEPQTTITQAVVWSKYNFVPGDKIIFDDNLSNEESGEFPSRWDLVKGSAENASLNGDNIIRIARTGIITPLMDNKDYLPEIFTIEFDAYYDANAVGYKNYNVRFWSGSGGYKNPSGDTFKAIYIAHDGISFVSYIDKQYRSLKQKNETLKNKYGWRHIAMAFNKRSLKIFIDEQRVLNLPNLGMEPQQFSIESNFQDNNFIGGIKNIRIAEGGKDLYERVMNDGKFVTNGILFNVNKSTIKPESMGVLNEVAKMMQDHQDLNFNIVGHTDSDGADDYNKNLSAERANSVKSILLSMGISSNRFQTEGKGESEPVAENTTPEGKANNRRVEFVKI